MTRARPGCWTCRARKKKCDERRPTCEHCENLGLECKGYGERPPVDRLPTSRAARITNVNTKNSKLLFQVWKPPVNLETGSSSDTTNSSSSASSSPSSSAPNGNNVRYDLSCDRRRSSSDLLVLRREDFPALQAFVTAHALFQLPSAASLRRNFALCPTIGDGNLRNMSLMSCYLSNLFPLFGHFYKPGIDDGGDNGPLGLIHQSKGLYYSCASLGLLYELLAKGGVSECQVVFSSELRRLHFHTLREVRKTLDSYNGDSLSTALDLTASVFQLLTLEIHSSIEGHWEMHWQATGKILALLIQTGRLPELAPLKARKGSVKPRTRPKTRPEANLTTETSLKFFAEKYVWIDILASVTFGVPEPSKTHFEYCHLIKDGTLMPGRWSGCEDWVMLALKESSSLLHERDRVLFLSKAVELEIRFRKGLSMLREKRKTLLPSLERERSLVTEAYIMAGLVYQQVQLHGKHIYSKEVRELIKEARTRLSELPKSLLIWLAWPYAIVASMCLPEEEAIFRGIVAAAERSRHWIGSVVKSKLVVEECWRLRTVDPNVTWVDAIESLGIRPLLA